METVHLASASAPNTPAAEVSATAQERQEWLTWSVGGSIGAFVGGILGFGSFVLIASALVGRLIARWYARRRRRSQQIIGFVAWSNTLTWMLPVVGMATAVASLALPGERHTKRNAALGWMGGALSVASAIYGVVRNHMV